MTKPKRYKRFSSEFKREAIMRASEEGMTDKAVCDELSKLFRALVESCGSAVDDRRMAQEKQLDRLPPIPQTPSGYGT